MSHINSQKKITTQTILSKKNSEKISMITCYDSAFAKIIDQSNIDIILIGDSLGNVVLGYQNTIPVKLEDMIHHSQAVSRSNFKKLLVADMPFATYMTCESTLSNGAKLVQEGGVHAIKLEGPCFEQVSSLVSNGIAVVAHLGLTPQSIHQLGSYGIQGKDQAAAQKLIDDAKKLEQSGAFCLVLEMVPSELAQKITEQLKIPTIGIGAGPHCDGQVLVLHDMLGFDKDFNPKFLKKYLNMYDLTLNALNQYDEDIKNKNFPDNIL